MDYHFFWRSGDVCEHLGVDRFQLAQVSEWIPRVQIGHKNSYLYPSAYIIGLSTFLPENPQFFGWGVPEYYQRPTTQQLIVQILERYTHMMTVKASYSNKELSELLNVGRSTIDDWINEEILVPDEIRWEISGPGHRNIQYFSAQQVWSLLTWLSVPS